MPLVFGEDRFLNEAHYIDVPATRSNAMINAIDTIYVRLTEREKAIEESSRETYAYLVKTWDEAYKAWEKSGQIPNTELHTVTLRAQYWVSLFEQWQYEEYSKLYGETLEAISRIVNEEEAEEIETREGLPA